MTSPNPHVRRGEAKARSSPKPSLSATRPKTREECPRGAKTAAAAYGFTETLGFVLRAEELSLVVEEEEEDALTASSVGFISSQRLVKNLLIIFLSTEK